MRRIAVLAAATLVLGTWGCGNSSRSGSPAAAGNSPHSSATTPAPAASAASNGPTLDINPCVLVTADDVARAFTPQGSSKRATFAPIGTTNPPVTESYQTRACGYSGTVPGIYTDKPADGTSVSIIITTQVDDANGGTAWKAQVEAGKTVGPYAIDPRLPNGAFLMGSGHIVAHKGKVIVEIESPDDVNGVLTNAILESLVKTAFMRTAG